MYHLIALLGGVIFGLGLVVSQMVNPAKVLNFLDVAGQWDPTLAMVFIGAIAVALPVYQWTLRNRAAPVMDDKFHLPGKTPISPTLIGGTALFGIGWGLAGFCPGPGLTAMAALLPGVFVFVAGLFLGIACHRFFSDR